jgi:4-amino-4-deoxy-L-arabinose transferase-like glycosyltransferase
MPRATPAQVALLAGGLLVLAIALRAFSWGAPLWNVDEAIHAAAARVILDGGVLYRDAIDQRTPLSYYALAAVFAWAGENNLFAGRVLVTLLIVLTGVLLGLAARSRQGAPAGWITGGLYVMLSSVALFPGDAYAFHTEWFVALGGAAAAALFFTAQDQLSGARAFAIGACLAGGVLSKQPALLEVAAPLAAVLYLALRPVPSSRPAWVVWAAGIAGWMLPVLVVGAYFLYHGAWRDAVFYTWTYNLAYYGPELSWADRFIALALPFRLIGATHPGLVILWSLGAVYVGWRLLQRQPHPAEIADNPALLYLAVWSWATWFGAASAGRDFDHYIIPFLAPFSLGLGWGLAAGLRSALCPRRTRPIRLGVAGLLLLALALPLTLTAIQSRHRSLPDDPSLRVAHHIRDHSEPLDRIFVWGFHPDIYLHADRRPASRFLYATFLTGLIPWTNTAPGLDTSATIVPGTMATLLAELQARPPRFIVDCSAGPNRHWQKYPLEDFPSLHAFVQQHYRPVLPHVFVPQGFRLFEHHDEPAAPGPAPADPLAPALRSALQLGLLGSPIAPHQAHAPHGLTAGVVDGRREFFAHAPSVLAYALPPEVVAVRGGFGLHPGAYAADNPHPSDGAEFVIIWQAEGQPPRVIWRRLLQPVHEPADRGLHFFHVTLPTPHQGGELRLEIRSGPRDNATSDWTFWSDIAGETYR